MLQLMAANWKMYKTPEESINYVDELLNLLKDSMPKEREVLIFASSINLAPTVATANKAKLLNVPLSIGAQNFYPAEEGAFTGENSLKMIASTGAEWLLVGHSERRALFHETDEFLAQKTRFALDRQFRVVFCVGESLQEREAGKLNAVLERQLKEGLKDLPANYKTEDLAIAYEPVWAIGTGKVAQHADILEAHGIIRALLHKILGEKATQIRILYGGSVKPENAGDIMKIENVNGVLVGGASLQAASFNAIVRA